MISSPEEYGLSAEATLDHRIAATAPDDFDEYWQRLREEVGAISSYFHTPVSGPVCRVVLPSLRAIHIAGRLTMPEQPVRGAVVTSHGYEAPDDFEGGDEPEEPWTAQGLATLRIRVRGYPPSTMGMDDLRGDWILQKIESADDWIARGAVADLIQAVRCLRRFLGDDIPLVLHGESFGAGLAVIAAAQLGRLDPDLAPSRLVVGLPSFGDWIWRAGRYCNGAGGQVNMLLDAWRGGREDLLRTLLLFDAALHAPIVDVPVLAKLAERDDVVPAPSAAAVFNAIGTTEKWRFVVPYGHYDGGLSNARRHALFERTAIRFADPTLDPYAVVAEDPAAESIT